MILPKTKKIAKELDWHKTKNNVFGLYKGYFFNVADSSVLSNPQFKFVTATTDILTEEQKLQVKNELDTNKKNLKFTTFEITDKSIFFQFAETLTYTKPNTVYSLFDFLVDLFKKLNISEQHKCHNCGTKDKIKYYNQNNSGVLLCNPCFREIENSYDDIERESVSNKKNYLTGFLGAIVFSIPGIIAWVLIAVYLERIASAMAMIIAFLGLKGYDFFKGRQGSLTKYLIVFSNIIGILIANATTVIVLLMNEGLTISQAIAEFETNDTVKDLFNENTIISFVLAFVVWVWLLLSLKDKKLTIKLADKFEK